jgi:transglutaminase-like putative cysteine protease
MQEYLRRTDVIDWDDPTIIELADALVVDGDQVETVSACFHWVRDEIAHSFDSDSNCVTCTASETLKNRTGICYAKSHLLAAILRANRIPAGFGYQRVALDTTFCLHGFNFVHLDDFDWLALDPRGNRDGITTVFDPPNVSLAFPSELPGEETFDTVFADPLGCAVTSLRENSSVAELRKNLPDWE